MSGRAAARTAAALVPVFGLAALRFEEYLRGGSVSFRDAGFFFVPWRLLTARLVREGSFPFWNPWAGNGRALAADPNGAVFWPLTPLVSLVGPTGLMLAQVALCLGLFFAALRWLGLSRRASMAGTLTLLFSGVFQTLPLLFTTLASAAPLPLAVVALSGLNPERRRDAQLRVAAAGVGLGLSFLGGEPAVALAGGVACGVVVLARAGADLARSHSSLARHRLAHGFAAALLAAGLACVQLLPAAGELSRSARRASMRAEDGALFWSVRPARLLTLLEPRLTGDPFAEDPGEYWGAGTFDAGNPYFYDLALGLLPLAFALASWRTPRGQGALALAGLGALLSLGRHLPGYAAAAGIVPVFRYPEKWWLLATFALAAAAASGVEELLGDDLTRANRFRRALLGISLALAAPLAVALLAARLAPGAFRDSLWAIGLGTGTSPPALVSALLLPLLASGVVTLVVTALAARWRLSHRALAWLLVLLFLADAGRRVAGSCPAGPPDRFRRKSAEVELVLAQMPRGRFFDDGADRPETAVRRAAERGGFDPLRPLTGAAFGVAYAGENDIDRMTPAWANETVRDLARLSWGEEKLRRLVALGVAVVRTGAPLPDPPGVAVLARFGGDRLLRVEEPRPEFSLSVPGRVEVLERGANRQRLRVSAEGHTGLLVVTRTFDPSWRATVNGNSVVPSRFEGSLIAIPVPSGSCALELRYENPLLATGAALSLVSLAVLALLLLGRWRGV